MRDVLNAAQAQLNATVANTAFGTTGKAKAQDFWLDFDTAAHEVKPDHERQKAAFMAWAARAAKG